MAKTIRNYATSNSSIRAATVADAVAMLGIYAPYIENSSITFETETPSLTVFQKRIEDNLAYGWLVYEMDQQVVGYAYACPHRERKAYQWCCEISVYVHQKYQRRGVASSLYRELLAVLKGRGLVNVYAGITLPNISSVGFHEALGFKHIGTYPNIGFKLGAWHAVGWWGLKINDEVGVPMAPKLG